MIIILYRATSRGRKEFLITLKKPEESKVQTKSNKPRTEGFFTETWLISGIPMIGELQSRHHSSLSCTLCPLVAALPLTGASLLS